MTPKLDTVELLRRLVTFDSTSRNSNLPIADFICDYVDRPGIRIWRNASPNADKTNLVVVAGPEKGDRAGLGLSGHMDVVPADEDDWNSDPFRLTEVDGRYVGWGSCDMKGFLALAINQLVAIAPERLSHPLSLILTYDEELGTLGAKRLVETWRDPEVLPAAVVIGEPTSLAVVRMHKGYLKILVEFAGQAAHSGYPHLGRNAIEPAARAILALVDLRRTLEQERPLHSNHFREVPFAALNIATVQGGVAINVIPDRCRVEIGVRQLPGMSSVEMVERIRTTLEDALGDEAFSLTVLGDSPPMILREDAPLYRLLCTEMQQSESRSVSFATDAGWFQTMGLECVIFGPGSISVAHKANEYLPIEEFERAASVLERVVSRLCVEAP